MPTKGAASTDRTRDAMLAPAAAPASRNSEQRRSRHGSAPPAFRPSPAPVPEASPESSPGPSAPTHADNGAVSGPLDGLEATTPKGVRQLDFATSAIGNDSDHGGSSSADHANFIHAPLDEADHNDVRLAKYGDRAGDTSPPVTLDVCEQESSFSPNSGPGNERADAPMMVDEMAPSSRLPRGEGMRESGPCSPSRVPGSPDGSIIDFHRAGSFPQDSSLLQNPPTPSLSPPNPPPPSALLEANLHPRGLQMVDTGGRGNCLFTSVIASVQHAAFLPMSLLTR